jgi:hypothetical protein
MRKRDDVIETLRQRVASGIHVGSSARDSSNVEEARGDFLSPDCHLRRSSPEHRVSG